MNNEDKEKLVADLQAAVDYIAKHINDAVSNTNKNFKLIQDFITNDLHESISAIKVLMADHETRLARIEEYMRQAQGIDAKEFYKN